MAAGAAALVSERVGLGGDAVWFPMPLFRVCEAMVPERASFDLNRAQAEGACLPGATARTSQAPSPFFVARRPGCPARSRGNDRPLMGSAGRVQSGHAAALGHVARGWPRRGAR